MRPTRLALLGLCAWTALAVGASLSDAMTPLWLAAGFGLVATLGADAWRLLRAEALVASRSLPTSLPVGVFTPVEVELRNPGRRPWLFSLHDHHPPDAEVGALPQDATVPPGGFVKLRYRFRPLTRGEHRFGPAEVLRVSPFGLWARSERLAGDGQEVHVYPDFRAAMRYSLLAAANRMGQIGIRKRRRRGEGMEFHQLRDYREGDSIKQFDWKATAKNGRVISREYQDERDQQIVFLLDCGRRMHARDGELSHFDHSLNALLLLANAALRQGDSVGLMSFAGERRWLAPRKGVGNLNVLLNSIYDLETTSRPSDVLGAAREVVLRLRKRSLVVLVSNLRDDDSDELDQALRLLRKRHLVLVASLREQALGEALAAPVHSTEDAIRNAASHQYRLARESSHDRLRGRGVLWLDSEPEELPARLVNRYLDIKGSGRL